MNHTQSNRPIFGRFFWNKNFHSSPYSPQPVILRGAEGEVAESIIQQRTLALRERGTVADGGWGPGKSPFSSPLIRPDGHLLPSKKVFLRY